MNGLNPANNVAGPMAGMPNGVVNGTPQRNATDQERHSEMKIQLNTYIYDYLLRNEHYEVARAMKSHTSVKVSAPGAQRRSNGLDENAMDTDSKDDPDSKRPADLPPAETVPASIENSFLFDWFTLFWEVFFAPRQAGKARAGPMATQYVEQQKQQSRMRQEQQQQFLRQPGMAGQAMSQYQQNMMRMQQQANMMGHPNNRLNPNVQRLSTMQLQARNQQMMHPGMDRGGPDVDMNGRARSPSAGDNAPSPAKRARLEGPQFAGQQMMPQGRFPQGMPPQMMTQPGMADTNMQMLVKNGINPEHLSPAQLTTFQNQNPATQKKTLDVYSSAMRQQHAQSMPQASMAPQGGPMMGNEMGEYYQQGMRAGMPQNGSGTGGNHALQDYQMQLMLLEQQNKKRLLMARQEQDNVRPDGQPGAIAGQPGNFAPNMSPQGSRNGPSPNPSEQMKRGTPKMGQMGLPGSPMPDPSMHGRGSPAPMNFDGNMPMGLMQGGMKGMPEGMQMGPNGAMRPPSSVPQFPNGPQAAMEAMRAAQAGRPIPNGTANWQQGPQGQAPGGVPPGAQGQQPPPQQPQQPQPQQMGTPRQPNAAMPPPQNVPAPATNGRAPSPAPSAPSGTPQQSNKPNPKKKDEKATRKRPTKKATNNAAATPSAAEAENPPPTPTPQTPMTPLPKENFNGQKQGQAPAANAQSAAPAAAPVSQPAPQLENDMMAPFHQMSGMGGTELGDFASLETTDVLEHFDFDAFLGEGSEDFTNLDPSLGFSNYEGLEAGGDGS